MYTKEDKVISLKKALVIIILSLCSNLAISFARLSIPPSLTLHTFASVFLSLSVCDYISGYFGLCTMRRNHPPVICEQLLTGLDEQLNLLALPRERAALGLLCTLLGQWTKHAVGQQQQ